ncbi:pleckstrin homology domain-containing family G member 7-like isoform X3 [Bolinopsis microptera]|uniref:pleckstrin homology domain-containing family G member 7-like isoform X3 n=1 Tax=Bolinopsis microptera TaxID=2820187 RepID=UPI003079F318
MNSISCLKDRLREYSCFGAASCNMNDMKSRKLSRIGRSVSLMARKPKSKLNRRTQSCKAKNGENSISENGSHDHIRRKSVEKVDIGTQTRFSLNRELIKDIDEMIKEQDVSESDDNSAELVLEDPPNLDYEWSDSEIRGVGSAWSVCSDPTPDKYPDMSGRQSDPNQDPLWADSYHLNRRAPVRYAASRSASMVESTLDPPIEENEDDVGSDSENLEVSCPVEPEEAGYQYRLRNQDDVCQEPDGNIQSVLSSLQSRRGAVHTAVIIADPKDKFKMPFFSKRKNDRKWSKTELNSVLSESSNDRTHPLADLMMSHWSELMEDRPHIDSVEYKHRDALWGLFRAELVYLIDQLKIIRDVFQGTLKIAKDNGMLCDIDESLLFPNVNKLYKVSNAFSLDLYKMFKEGNASDEAVVEALQEFSKKFHHPYQRYCLNYTRAVKYLKTLKKERSDFREYEKLCLEDSRCKKRQLSDLLICPMQHLMRYVILLQDIQKHVPEDGRDDLRETIEAIQESLRSLESKLATLQNFQRLQELDNILIWPKIDTIDKSIVIPEELKEIISEDQSTLCSDGRHILHAGALLLLENPKSSETYCFLFNDMLLIARTNSTMRKRYNSKLEQLVSPSSSSDAFDTSGGLYDPDQRYIVYKQPIALDETRVHDITTSPGGCRHCFAVTTYNRLKCCTGLYTFNAVSADNKRQWIEKLRKTSEDFRTSNPATPINRRPRVDSMHINNGDSISLNSGNSSFNENPDTPTGLPGSNKKPAHSQSFKSNNSVSVLQKIPKRCRSAS